MDNLERLCKHVEFHNRSGVESVVEHVPNVLTLTDSWGWFNGVIYVPENGRYTRRLQSEAGHNKSAILGMCWPEGCETLIHGHGWLEDPDDPESYVPSWCIDRIMEGEQQVIDYDRIPTDDPWIFRLVKRERHVARAGQNIVVDPRVTDTHKVIAPKGAKSIHVYARSLLWGVCYEHIEGDFYRMKVRELPLD